MKHKVSELTGTLLDTAVAIAQGWKRARVFDRFGKPWDHDSWCEDGDPQRSMHNAAGTHSFAPSVSWLDGGPIIERERIAIYPGLDRPEIWVAAVYRAPVGHGQNGPTPLIAAMRAYVSSKFGEEVELP